MKGYIKILIIIIFVSVIYQSVIKYKNEYFDDKKNIKYALCLKDMKTILNKLNIPFFLTFGTSLGYHREKKILEHDYDIDIGIFYNDCKKNISDKILSSALFRKHGEWGELDDGKEYSFIHKKTNVRIDLYIFYEEDDYLWTATYAHPLCSKMKYNKCRWKYSKFKPTEIKFLDDNYYIVPIKFLEEQYGDWKIPKKVGYSKSVNNWKEYRPNLIYEPK